MMMSSVNQLLDPVRLPEMAYVKQQFDSDKIENVEETLRKELEEICRKVEIRQGMSIAVTAGSRGIHNYAQILKTLICFLKEKGAQPFIIPAMGSHGGATAAGQKKLLAGYGITEASMSVPIRATMETVVIGELDGETVCLDRYASEADGIVIFNRIKPHTGFRGDYESGLVKICAIGLGKQTGAERVHSHGSFEMGERVAKFGTYTLTHAKVLFGLGVVENSCDETKIIRAMTPGEILKEEPELLSKARALMPKILFENLDVLIVDQIGKNISGPGMDPNITYSFRSNAAVEDSERKKRAQRIVVLRLTKETHGSALGIGLADITTIRLFEQMSLDMTYPNGLTGTVTESSKIPMMFDSDEHAIKAAVKTIPMVPFEKLRIVRIQDTLHVETLQISEALLKEAEEMNQIEVFSKLEPFSFDEHGNLLP